MTKYTRTADIPPFGLRMKAELKSRIENAAGRNGRSQNAEIVARLEESFVSDVTLSPDNERDKRISTLEKAQSALLAALSDQADEIELLSRRVRQVEQRIVNSDEGKTSD